MASHPTTVVVCRGAITREAVARSLRHRMTDVVGSHAAFAQVDRPETGPDVMVYVETSHDEELAEAELAALGRLATFNWVVICAEKTNPVYAALRQLGARVSAIPTEIADDELGHVVRLAARRRSVCVDDACEACPGVERSRLIACHLDAPQWELLRELADGHPNKVIARNLNCAESTVKARLRGLMDRLGVTNRTQAAVLAAKAGLSGQRGGAGPLRNGQLAH